MRSTHVDNSSNKSNKDFCYGLSTNEVNERKEKGLVNKTSKTVGKTYFQIVRDNVLSFFNIMLYIIAILMIIGQYYTGLLFLLVLIPNILLGLYEDIKARRLMDKLSILNAPKANVIRDNKQQAIQASELVLDDVVLLANGSQISADGTVLNGTIGVNESLLTGEPDTIYKKEGDLVYSGSYVVSGEAYVKVLKVGDDSYVQSIEAQAKQFKRSKSQILQSLKLLFRVIGSIVILMAIAMIILYSVRGQFSSYENFKQIIGPLSGSLVSMIPSGLYLLTSVSLAVAVISLSGKRAHVQDFYAVEMLARTNVLCVDKTGTITDGTLLFVEAIGLEKYLSESILSIAKTIVNETKDNNATAQAIIKAPGSANNTKPIKTLPFNSENKYSAISYEGETYILGALEFINVTNKNGLLKRYDEYIKKGYRVLAVAKSNEIIKSDAFNYESKVIGFLLLKDHIKEDAYKTFKMFNDAGVMIKVISGDNALTVSEVAKQAGILHSEDYISLENVPNEEIDSLVDKYTIFGRVSPEQKQMIVESLQARNKTVAMTGDGVNDILALKKADCSIAMANGSDAARNASHIVLMDSNFSSLPNVVDEGRRVVNNIQRTSSLFLVKTGFAMFYTLLFLILGIFANNKNVVYPFVTNNMYLWEMFAIGFASFFLALERNNDLIQGKFLTNIFSKAIPGAITMILGAGICYILYLFQYYGIAYTGVYTLEAATSMGILTFSCLSVAVLFKVAFPFSKYRAIVFGAVVVMSAALIAIDASFAYAQHLSVSPILRIRFFDLNNLNYLTFAIITLGVGALYLFVTYLIKVVKIKDIKEIKKEEE